MIAITAAVAGALRRPLALGSISRFPGTDCALTATITAWPDTAIGNITVARRATRLAEPGLR